MFKNIGATIKIMAKVIWWFGTLTLTPFLFWPLSFMMYGFGELVESSTKTAQALNNSLRLNVLETQSIKEENAMSMKEKITSSVIEEIVKESQKRIEENIDYDPENIAQEDECPACFHKISPNDTECTYCGYKLK